MDITVSYTSQSEEHATYERLLKKIFPTIPLYIFLSITIALLVFMVIQHIASPSTYSLVFISISLLCVLFGGSILLSTKKSLPRAKALVMGSVGKSRKYRFTDAEISVSDIHGESINYRTDKLVGQYFTGKYYVFCIAEGTKMLPVVIGVTPENVDWIDEVVKHNNARGIKLKKLKMK